jgi:hypothetical protein
VKPIPPPHVHPGAAPIVFAKDQPEYEPLPAAVDMTTGLVLTEWELSAEDLAALVNGGRVRLWIWTFRHPLQPVRMEVVE